jgi:antitoxin VapB
MLFPPILHIEAISNSEADRLLLAWEHKMGPCRRPMGTLTSHGMFAHGQLVAVSVTAALVAETCAGLSRREAIELARLCAGRPHLSRPMLRLWREFIFPCFGRNWAVSYQDEALHTGNTYRLDGWVRLRERASSGTDLRSNRKGRSKTIWGWHNDPAMRASASIDLNRGSVAA